jgi:histidyl-tRNA synthetase
MRLFGYKLIELPIIDVADLFLVKAGDQIISSLFTFERQGKQYALRPEFTASAANYFAKTGGTAVARWQFAGSVFEDNLADPNTNSEHFGIGAELIGLNGSLADAEIIAMAASGLEKLNISDYHITIGHIGLIRELLKQFSLDSRTERFLLHQIGSITEPQKGKQWVYEQFLAQLVSIKAQATETNIEERIDYAVVQELNAPVILSDLPMMGGRTQADIARRLKMKHQRYVDKDNVLAAIEFLHQWCQIAEAPEETFRQISRLTAGNTNAEHLLQRWRETSSLLDAHGILLSNVTIKPSLARSWEYYTGIVFELHQKDLHLGGGGRYDELVRLIGGDSDVPSVGFAYYGDRLIDLLSPESHQQILTLLSHENDMAEAAKWANKIRGSGISVQIAPYSLPNEGNLDVLYLNASGIRYQESEFNVQQIDLLINQLKHIQ